jgi:hypothetical protein
MDTDATNESNFEILLLLLQPYFPMGHHLFLYCLIVECDESNTDKINTDKIDTTTINLIVWYQLGLVDIVWDIRFALTYVDTLWICW